MSPTPEGIKDTASKIKKFLTSSAFAVIGASTNRSKYGNKVLRCYLQHNKKVYPVNPHEDKIEDISCFHRIEELPNDVNSISIVTRPNITDEIVGQAIAKEIKNVWMQPGAESKTAVEKCIKHRINIIANGPCILRELGFQEIYEKRI